MLTLRLLSRNFFATSKSVKGSDAILKQIKDSKNPVLLNFYAQGCQNCTSLAPKLDKEIKNNEKLEVLKINIKDKQNADLLSKYNVKDAPRLILVKEGKTVSEKSGNISEEELKSLLK